MIPSQWWQVDKLCLVGRQSIQLHLLGLQWDSGDSDDSDDSDGDDSDDSNGSDHSYEQY